MSWQIYNLYIDILRDNDCVVRYFINQYSHSIVMDTGLSWVLNPVEK